MREDEVTMTSLKEQQAGDASQVGMFEHIKGTVHDRIHEAVEVVHDAAEHAAEVVHDAAEHAAEVVHDAAEHAKEKVTEHIGHARENMQLVAERAFGHLHTFNMVSTEFAKVVDTWMKDRIRGQLEAVLDRLPAIIKGALNGDPDMNQKVWRLECRWIDSSWGDVRRELLSDLCVMLSLHPPPNHLKDPDDPGPDCFRRYWRYHLFPYNKSFWGRLRHPMWYLFMFLWLNPISAISGSAFLFTFLIIDRSDEYQLIQFILANKGAQFVAHALMRTFVGYFMYLSCITGPAQQDVHACAESGPGTTGPTWLIMGGWLFQISLAWLAVVLIPCTREHVGVNQAFDEPGLPPEPEGTPRSSPEGEGGGAVVLTVEGEGADAGEASVPALPEKSISQRMLDHYTGRAKSILMVLRDEDKRHIRRVMMYDLVCLVVVLSCLTYFVIRDGSPDHVGVRQTLFACQVAYGYLSLPFFIFSLPMIQKSLLHVRRTAYDELGRCRFFRGAERPRREPPSFSLAALNLGDTDKLLGNIMNSLQGRGEAEDGSIFHTFEPTTLVVPTSCGYCKGRLKGMGSKAMKCVACGEKWCEECAKQQQEPCEEKAKQKKEREEEDAEEAKEKAQREKEDKEELEETTSASDMKQRFDMFTKYWRVSGDVLSALMKIDGMSIAQNPGQFKEVMQSWLKKQSHGYIEGLIDRIPGILKWLWEEPDMPNIVKKGKDQFVDVLWGEIQEEILYNFKVVLDGEQYVKEEEDDSLGVDCCRARCRHALLPYDKSIWWQIKDPVFIIFSLLPMIPWAAMVPFTFLIIFIIIDKTDEFQLVQFILRFKGTQFITHGLIKNIIGFFTYWSCVTELAPIPADDVPITHTCAKTGPGLTEGFRGLFAVEFGGWCLMILLTYISFALLPCSKEKGRVKLTSEDLADKAGAATDIAAGGSLRYLAIYDFLGFAACLSVMLYVMHLQSWETDWVVSQTFFAVQVVYGYLALPFFFISLPGLNTILTHSVATGYDSKGRIRAYEGPPRKDEEVLAAQYKVLEAEQRRREGLPPLEEEEDHTQGLLGRIQTTFAQIFNLEMFRGGSEELPKDGEGTPGKEAAAAAAPPPKPPTPVAAVAAAAQPGATENAAAAAAEGGGEERPKEAASGC